MSILHEGVEFGRTQRFRSQPRSWDREPSTVPMDHPLRAVTKILHDAPINTTVPIFCYSLTDPMMIDWIIHHGSCKSMRIIVHPNDGTVSKLKQFLDRFSRFGSYDAFFARVDMRVADVVSPPCSRFSSMHDTRVITDSHCTYGSYNLSCAARFANWEALYVADTDQADQDCRRL